MAKRVALADACVTEDVTDAGSVRAEGRDHAGGQRLAEQVQALEHARAGEAQVHRSSKIRLIIRKPKADDEGTTRARAETSPALSRISASTSLVKRG